MNTMMTTGIKMTHASLFLSSVLSQRSQVTGSKTFISDSIHWDPSHTCQGPTAGPSVADEFQFLKCLHGFA